MPIHLLNRIIEIVGLDLTEEQAANILSKYKDYPLLSRHIPPELEDE